MASPIGSVPPPEGGPGPSGPPTPRPPTPSQSPPPAWAAPRPPTPAAPPPAVAPGAAAPGRQGTPVFLPDGWVGTVTDKIVSTVDGVRAKTTVPIEKVGRVVIWGLLIATAGISLLLALLIGVLRLLYELGGNIPGFTRPGRSVWMIDVLIGVVLISVGLLFLRKASPPQPED